MDETKISWPGWETVGLIGHGNFGAVYEIRRKLGEIEEKAALKVIRLPQSQHDIDEMYSNGYDEEDVTTAFQSHLDSIISEYSLMRKMNGHTNIVSCDDIRYVQRDDGIGWDIFIKMELLTPLTKALPAQIDEQTTVKIAKDICSALVLCKKSNIIHRDVKPQNIFMSEFGDYKLGDFGIAKTVEKTSGGTMAGTGPFMAPEVAHFQPYGHSADIYSLGIVLYWLLNERRLPFMPLPPEKPKISMELEAKERRLRGEPLPAPAHGSKALQAIVLKACAFDPAERYYTAAEMLQDLEKLGGAVVTGPGPEVDPDEERLRKEKEERERKEAEEARRKAEEERIRKEKAEQERLRKEREEEDRLRKEREEQERLARERAEQESKERAEQERLQREQQTHQKPKKKKWWLGIAVVAIVVLLLVILLPKACGNQQSQKAPQTNQPSGVVSHEHTWVDVQENRIQAAYYRGIAVEISSATDAAKHEAAQQAQGILAKWHATGGTEEAFIELCNRYPDGLATKDVVRVLDFNNAEKTTAEYWLFDAGRASGDVGIVDTVNAYWVFYFVSGGTYTIDSDNPQYCSLCKETNGELIPWVDEQEVAYYEAAALEAAGEYGKAAIAFGKLGEYQDSASRSKALWDTITANNPIAAGHAYSVGLRTDGTVVANGTCAVEDWQDIVAIAAGVIHTVGLRANGTVVAAGVNFDGQCEVEDWQDIVAVAAGDGHTVGLRANGTVVAVGDNNCGQCEVEDWQDIVAVAVGWLHIVGLHEDGTVVAAGHNYYGQCEVEDWRDIVAIAAGAEHSVGLRADGTAVAVGHNNYGECEVEDWRDIVAIAAGSSHTVGLCTDGTAMAVGRNDDGQCDVEALTNIKVD